MLALFSADKKILGVMTVVSTFLWVAVTLYNVWYYYQAKKVYNLIGGNEAAKREFGQIAVQTAVDNKETIIQVAKDNKETIKQVAYDNKVKLRFQPLTDK